LTGGFPGVEVGAAFGGVAELDDGHDVQDTVDSSVAGAGESMALLVTDIGQQPRRAGRLDPVGLGEGGAAVDDHCRSSVSAGFDLAVDALEVGDPSRP
jgi:hypothetical protein